MRSVGAQSVPAMVLAIHARNATRLSRQLHSLVVCTRRGRRSRQHTGTPVCLASDVHHLTVCAHVPSDCEHTCHLIVNVRVMWCTLG